MIARTLLALCLVTMTGVPAQAEDEVVHDHWYAKFQGGRKTGWEHSIRVRSQREGKTVIVTETESVTVRGPSGEKLETPIRGTARFEESEDGVVLSYATAVDIGFGPQTREGKTADGKIRCVEDGKEREVPYPEGALGPAGVDRAISATLKPNGKGSVTEFRAIDPTSSGKLSWKVPESTQLIDVLGVHAWLFVVEKDDGALPESLFYGPGGVWGGTFNMGLVQYLRTEEVVAKADREPTSWLTDRIVAPDRAIHADATKRVVLRLSKKDGDVELPESQRQRVIARNEDGSVDVELLRGEPQGELVVWMRPYNGDDIDAAYFEATPLIELAHPRVKAMAESMVGEVMDGLGCARVLELRVRQAVRSAPANVGFASAAGVISARTGDSTETAVLVTALARSLGLPARIVSGFTYFGPEDWPGGAHPKGAFAFHVWAEVYAGENLWHPVDPMRVDGGRDVRSIRDLVDRGGVGPTHVAVLRSDLATETPFTDLAVPVLEFLDGVEIRVVEPAE